MKGRKYGGGSIGENVSVADKTDDKNVPEDFEECEPSVASRKSGGGVSEGDKARPRHDRQHRASGGRTVARSKSPRHGPDTDMSEVIDGNRHDLVDLRARGGGMRRAEGGAADKEEDAQNETKENPYREERKSGGGTWIKDAHLKKGAFTADAKRAGKSVHQMAERHKGDSGKEGKRARLALTFEKMAHKGK